MYSNESQSAEDCWLQDKFSIRKLLPPDSSDCQPKIERRRRRINRFSAFSATNVRQVGKKNLIAPVALIIMFTSFILSAQQQLIEATNYRDDDDIFISTSSSSSHIKQPQFVDPESSDNVQRVPIGRSVKFKCVVNNLGNHRVAWFHKDKRILLALDNKTIVWKDRIHATSQGDSVFFLQIDSVQLGDKGHYICQLNTQPVQSQVHILEVSKPPQIKEQETTTTIEPVKEFSPVELRCVADGIPKPSIKWRRESKMHVIPQMDEDEPAEGDNDQYMAKGNEIDGLVQSGDSNSKMVDSQMAVAANSNNNLVEATDLNQHENKLAHDEVTRPPVQSPIVMASSLDGNSSSSRQDSAKSDALNFQNGTRSSFNSTGGSGGSNGGSNGFTYDPNKLFIGEGEVLRFDRATRYDMGFYMCIASNGVPPSVSQRIFLPVSFIPKASVSSTRVLQHQNGRSGKTLDTANTSMMRSGANSLEATSNGVNLLNTTTRPKDGSGRSAATIARQHRKYQRIASSSILPSSSSSSSASSSTTTRTTEHHKIMAIVLILMYIVLYQLLL